MNAKLLLCAAMVSAVLCSAVFAQDPPEDPFGGGFAINQDAEIFTLGLTSSLRGGAFDWLSDLDTILTIWSGSFPGTSGICLKRDIAAANFNSDYFDEMVVAWSRSDNGVFVGIPTIDPVTMAPDPAGWHVPDPPGAAGALYATDNLADLLGGIRVVVGNFYADPTMEFVLAYLAADSTVFLSVFDVDTATLTPVLKGTISDQAVNTEVEASQLSDWMSRFDVATGDLDGDGLDEIVLVANDPAQSPGTDLMVDVYDYDTLAHAIVPVSKMRFTANDNLNHTCLRRLAAEAANFDADSRDEIALVHRWANPVNDTSRVGTMNILKLNSEMTVIDYSSDEALPTVPRWGPVNGVSGDICNMTVYNDDLIVGGDFTAAGGISANYIARWDGTNWYPLGSGLNATVLRLTVYNGELIAGGKFTSAGGVSAKYIARWDGSAWHSVGSGMSGSGASPWVTALEVYDGDLIAAGYFDSAGGVSAPAIARWDGTNWYPLGWGSGDEFDPWIFALTVFNGDLIAGGDYFGTIGGVIANGIARWDGSDWHTLGSFPGYYVKDLIVYSGQLIATGGLYGTLNGIGRWNGSTWQSLGTGFGAYDVGYALAVYSGNLIAGGRITKAGGVSVNNVARWNGSAWFALGSGVSGEWYPVQELTIYDGDLFAGGDLTTSGGTSANHIARWDGSNWYPIPGASKDLPMDLTAGNIDGNAPEGSAITDELFITGCRENADKIEQYLKVYRFDSASAVPDVCLTSDATVVDSIASGLAPRWLYLSRRSMALGNLTGDGWADLALLLSDNTGDIGIKILELYPDTSSACGIDSVLTKVSWASLSDNMSELVLADLDTGTVTIGPPKAYRVDSLIQPLAIINAPPVHFDVIDDTVWDVSNRYPIPPPADYDTYVDYYNATGFSITTETEIHRDWGISRSLDLWAQSGGFNVSAYLDTEYGEGFSKKGGYSKVVSVGATVDARTDDKLRALIAGYDILEYPVFRGGDQVGHVVVVSPDTNNIESWKAGRQFNEWTPAHEVENVLSYSSIGDIDNNFMVDPDAGGVIRDVVSFELDPGMTSEWFLGQNTFQYSDVTTLWDFGVAVGGSFGYEGGFRLFGIGIQAGFQVGVDAEYSEGQINTYSTCFSNTDSLHLVMGYITGAPEGSQNRKYDIVPYAYWARNGALVLDFATNPRVGGPGDPETWWQEHYGNPDPAFFLPGRLDTQKWGTIADDNRFRTKEIAFIPSKPAPGDTVLIVARVHNLSLVPTPDSVKVSFYLGDPDFFGEILKDKNTGDSVFYACDTLGAPVAIEARGEAYVEMVWEVPQVGDISSCQRIWAYIDPLDEISPEVHDNTDSIPNNKGWRLLYVDTPADCVDPDGDGWESPAFRCHTCPNEWDNCPNVYNDQTDSDGDGIGDACEPVVIICGDANGDTEVNVGDAVFLINYVFKQGPPPDPVCSGNANGDGDTNVGDAVYLINYVFKSGPPPVENCCS